jgi:hypothetical protein
MLLLLQPLPQLLALLLLLLRTLIHMLWFHRPTRRAVSSNSLRLRSLRDKCSSTEDSSSSSSSRGRRQHKVSRRHNACMPVLYSSAASELQTWCGRSATADTGYTNYEPCCCAAQLRALHPPHPRMHALACCAILLQYASCLKLAAVLAAAALPPLLLRLLRFYQCCFVSQLWCSRSQLSLCNPLTTELQFSSCSCRTQSGHSCNL